MPPGTTVLVLGEDEWGHGPALQALGMTVVAVAEPASCEWVVIGEVAADADALSAARRALLPGGWVWVASRDPGLSSMDLGALARRAGLAESEAASADVDDGDPFVRGIYRRVENDTIA